MLSRDRMYEIDLEKCIIATKRMNSASTASLRRHNVSVDAHLVVHNAILVPNTDSIMWIFQKKNERKMNVDRMLSL